MRRSCPHCNSQAQVSYAEQVRAGRDCRSYPNAGTYPVLGNAAPPEWSCLPVYSERFRRVGPGMHHDHLTSPTASLRSDILALSDQHHHHQQHRLCDTRPSWLRDRPPVIRAGHPNSPVTTGGPSAAAARPGTGLRTAATVPLRASAILD